MKGVNVKVASLFSFGSVLFFASLIWLPVITFKTSFAISWYPIAVLSTVLGIWSLHFKIRMIDLFLVLLLGITGFINWAFVGNISINRLIYMCMSVFISFLLMNPFVQAKHIRNLLYINALLLLVMFLFFGAKEVYNGASENYVSVFAIEMVTYFYVLWEHQGGRTPLFPAIMTFIVCLFAQGRGGMLCSLLLLLGIWICVYRDWIFDKWLRYIIVIFTILLVGGILVFFVSHIDSLNDNPVFSHFERNGFKSEARTRMWNGYTARVVASSESVLYGHNYDNVPRIAYHKGNPHSSFIDIHGLHGGITFVVVMFMIIYAYRWAFKQGKWIYLICFSVFMLRGFTDRMFWGQPGTPLFFFFLLLPYHWDVLSQSSQK